MPRRRAWPTTDLGYLKFWAGRKTYAEIGRKLGRSESSVKSQARKLGIKTREPFTPDEDAYLRAHYRPGVAGVAAGIGKALDRPVGSVHHRASTLGLQRRNFVWTAASIETLRTLNAAGESDTQIATALGAERHVVSKRRRGMGLRSMANGPRARLRIAEAARRQCERYGIPDVSHLRNAIWMANALDRGWPTEINGRRAGPRIVQILDALHDHGPHTRQQLCERIGMPWRGSRDSMVSNGRGGSYLAELMRAGLVVCLGRQVVGKGKGKSVNLYALAPNVERNHAG
jgi:hypothetical protein